MRLEKAVCLVGNNFIRAVDCTDNQSKGYSGGYVRGEGIIVCSNAIDLQDDVNQVVIHAFDDCRAANLDWSSCAHHACSEVCIKQLALAYVKFDKVCSIIL